MYTILITDSNELIASVKERIMQKSKLANNLHFLTALKYKDLDMSNFTATLEYRLPSGEVHSLTLNKSEKLYDGKLEYVLPFDTLLTKEAGEVEIAISFTSVEMDADGNKIAKVRKTSATKITIIPVEAWSDFVPDSALTALDQRILKADAMINQLTDLKNSLEEQLQNIKTYENVNQYKEYIEI